MLHAVREIIPMAWSVLSTAHEAQKCYTAAMRQGFFDKFMSRLDRIDAPVASAHIAELARERGFLETLFQSIDEGLIVVGAGARLLYANRAAERMVGFSFEERQGKSLARHLRDWGLDALLCAQIGDWSRIETRVAEVSYPEHRFISFYARPLPFDGRTELMLMLRDVTREHAAEEDALADERLAAVRTLAAGVAHEIGNPLNALTIHLQLLGRGLRDVPDLTLRESLQSLAETAERETSRLDGILRRFLAAIRPAKPTLVRGNVRDVLDATLRLLSPDIEQRRINLQTAFPEAIPDVFLDAQQLEQVFFNLLRNAMEAVPDGGRIGVTLTVDDAWVNVSVLDNGVGIPTEALGRIFDPYVTTKAKGNGLGLMIVRRIVQAHGGGIDCASRPGEGTCFTVRLPRAERRVRTLPAAKGKAAMP